MTFLQEPTRVATDIGNIIVMLKDVLATDEDPAIQEAFFDIKIIFDDGTTVTRKGNLTSHITPAERAALIGFMTTLRARAIEQIIIAGF